MASGELNSFYAIFVMLASLLCIFAGIISLKIGGVEEILLGSMVAIFVVFHNIARVIGPIFDYNFVLSAALATSVEMVISCCIAVTSKRYWTVLVAAIFLVKAFSWWAQFWNLSVGIFADDVFNTGSRVAIASIIIVAACLGKTKSVSSET